MALLAIATAGIGHAQKASEKAPVVDCGKLIASIKSEVSSNQSFVLQIVERAIRENSSCACEIVKAAIQATNADSKLIGSIVEVVGLSAPEQLRLSAQCAVAVAPDALDAVQAVLAKLDPGTGDGDEISAKGGSEKAPAEADDDWDEFNPLYFPEGESNNNTGNGNSRGGSNGDSGSGDSAGGNGGGEGGDGGGSGGSGGSGSTGGNGSGGGGGGGSAGGGGGGGISGSGGGGGGGFTGGGGGGAGGGGGGFGGGGLTIPQIKPPKGTKNGPGNNGNGNGNGNGNNP